MNKDTNPKHWKLRIFYYNPDNPSEVVDKKNGIGTTINFGSKYGRRIFALIIMPAFIVLLIVLIITFLNS